MRDADWLDALCSVRENARSSMTQRGVQLFAELDWWGNRKEFVNGESPTHRMEENDCLGLERLADPGESFPREV